MRSLPLWLAGCLLCSVLVLPQEQQRIPPGIQKAVQGRTVPTEPPIVPRRNPPDASELRRQAEELARLAQSLPPEVEQMTQGVRPKELEDKLKRIEKLSKRLRNALFP